MRSFFFAKSYIPFAAFLSFIIFTFFGIFVKYSILNSYSIGGHDTFQYIHWADILFSSDRVLIFFRPLLYLIIFNFHDFFSWSSYAFKFMLHIFWFLSFLACIFFYYKGIITKVAFFASLYIITFSPLWLTADAVGYVTSIETFFLLIFLIASFYFSQNKSLLSFAFLIFAAISMCFIHEEKIIFTTIMFFLLADKLKLFLSLFFIKILIIFSTFLALGGQTVGENSLLIAGSVATSWQGHLNLATNVLSTLVSSSNQFNFLESSAIILLFFYLAFLIASNIKSFIINNGLSINFFTFQSIKSNFFDLNLSKANTILIIPSFYYLIFVGILFAGIDLPRTIALILFPFLMGLCNIVSDHLKFDFTKNYFIFFITLLLSAFSGYQKSDSFINNHDSEELKYYTAYKLIKDEGFQCNKNDLIGIDHTFDSRGPMWGGSNNYGLRSKVYFGEECTISLNLSTYNSSSLMHLDKRIGIIVSRFNENELSNEYISSFKENGWKFINHGNIQVFKR